MAQAAKKPKAEKEAHKTALVPVAEARAYAKYIRSSPRKLNLVAASIRGLDCSAAIATATVIYPGGVPE